MPDPRVEELDEQIDLLETLRDFDAELKDFSSWLDTLTKGPKTGDLAADFEIGQMRDLLLKLSDQLGHYTDPLNQASALAGRISGLVTALDAISTAASNPDAPPDQIITALGDFISGLNSALPLFGRVFGGLNPVIGVYILLLGEMIKGIARSVQVIARQVEVRNDAIDMFDDVIEGRYDLPDQDQVEEDQAQDALEAELTDLYLRRARLERQLRETDYRNALRICLRRRNQNENIYEGDVAELEAHEEEWATLTTISTYRDLTDAEQERLERLTEMIHRRRAQIQEIQRCVRELLEQVRTWRGGAAVMGGGCLWALIPFLLVSVLGVGGVLVLRGDDGPDTAVGSPTSSPSSATTASPSSTSSSTTSSTEPPLVLDDLVAEHGSIAEILFDVGAPLGQIDRILDRFAPDDDAGVPQFIYSMEGHDVTGNGEPGIDITDWYLGELDTTLLPGLVDGALPCGLTGTRVVVCPDAQSEVPGGPVVVAAMRLAGPVPLTGSDRQYIYSAVFETDGDPANDWVAQDPYGWDYFQGTDRWFEGLGMLSSQQWELDVVAVSSAQQQSVAPSDAILVIEGDAAAFFIPAGEVGGTEGLCGRLTAFVTDGSYSPETSAGDISGGAPTATLWNLEGAEC